VSSRLVVHPASTRLKERAVSRTIAAIRAAVERRDATAPNSPDGGKRRRGGGPGRPRTKTARARA
jgi:hypothetical protein